MGPTDALKAFQKGKLPLLSAENRDITPHLSSSRFCRRTDRAIEKRCPASVKHNYGLLMLTELEGTCFVPRNRVKTRRFVSE